MNIFASGIWARAVNAAAGIWLMASPAVLGYDAVLPGSVDRVIGPLVASLAVISMWEATRGVRHANTVLGACLILAPLALGYATVPAVNSVLTGVVVVALSRIEGRYRHTFGGGWKSLWARRV